MARNKDSESNCPLRIAIGQGTLESSDPVVAVNVDHDQGFTAPRIAREVECVLVDEMPPQHVVGEVSDSGLVAEMVENLVVQIAVADLPVPLVTVVELTDPFPKPSCNCYFSCHTYPHNKKPLDAFLHRVAMTCVGTHGQFLCWSLICYFVRPLPTLVIAQYIGVSPLIFLPSMEKIFGYFIYRGNPENL